ncbi:hypothetical protein CRD60_01025 [Bifidobacterium aemilianum]|uniref:Uncharacterized protein n=1 Tax=Bifidobacterium aemilianum TaxID=2493120 RepID=A0A366KA55_9BIFI|nr:hypothetical protein [Bifidobacterium aemilianum]RBP98479.1 hypothetical protein CRD60_01025 [Bifidobacterium aemilianum]
MSEKNIAEGSVWARIAKARESMSLEKSGGMTLGGDRIQYATIDDLYKTVSNALMGQDLWLNTPLEGDRVHVRVVDVRTGESQELLSYPCVLTGRDVKADAGMWTSCKRYAITSAFNLASGDEGGTEQAAARQEERQTRGFVAKRRFQGVPAAKLTEIRGLLVRTGVTDPKAQRETVGSIIGREVQGRLDDANLTPAEADRLVEELSGRPQTGEAQQ